MRINFPFFSFAYFLFTLLFKAGLLWVSDKINLYPYFFYFLLSDILFLFFIFILLDIPVFFIRKQSKMFYFFYFIFFIIILLQTINFRFYTKFGTFITYSLLMQVDRVDNFRESILLEIDGIFFLLLVFSILFLIVYLFVFKEKEKITVTKKSLFLLLAFLLFIGISTTYAHRYPADFSGLDKNPFYLFGKNFYDEYRENKLLELKKNTEKQQLDTNNAVLESIFKQDRPEINPLSFLKPKNNSLMNIVILVLESTYAGYTGIFNPEMAHLTPHINALAQNALILKNHYTQEPASLKVRYSIIAGKYSNNSRNWERFVKKVAHHKTLPEILKKYGYQSLYLSSGDLEMHYENVLVENRFDIVWDRENLKERYPHYQNFDMGIDDRAIRDAFEDYLKTAKKPFLAILTPMMPHHPYTVPDKKFKKYPQQSFFERYKNSLYFQDYVIGSIYETLKKYNMAEDTIFVLVSDHGEAFYQHPGNYAHAIYLYEENVRTLCLFVNPKIFPTTYWYENPTSHVDITPSLLDMLSLPIPDFMDGISFFSSYIPNRAVFFYTRFGSIFLGVRDKEWKYIYNKTYNTEELFHLPTDPKELYNVAEKNKELATLFRKKIMELEKKITY